MLKAFDDAFEDSGFSGGNDEKVAVYDKPLFADRRSGAKGG